MVSLLIYGGTAETRQQKAIALCEELGVSPFDRMVFGQTPTNDEEKSPEQFGITQIRQLRQHSLLMPAHGTEKALILLEGHRLSIPAQNALLKLLEEPPRHTTFIIASERASLMLETIRSRCKSIMLETVIQSLSEKDEETIGSLFREETLSLGEKLELAEKVSKEDPASWVRALLLVTQSRIVLLDKNKEHFRKLGSILAKAQKAHADLETTNTNPRLIIENLILSV